MKTVKQLLLAGIPVVMLLSSNAFAGLKIDNAEVAELKKVAVVGYSLLPVERCRVRKSKRLQVETGSKGPEAGRS